MLSRYVRIINGVTFIDAVALELSIDNTPAKYRLRQKMINAGVEFWNDDRTIVKKPVIGISAVGGFPVCLDDETPAGMIKFYMGDTRIGPIKPDDFVKSMRINMGIQAAHTYMNPNSKSPMELYDATVNHGHFSIAHAASLGFYLLGISKKAELEFDVQRDLLHLARETSARCAAQDEPTLVAMTERGALLSEKILADTAKHLQSFEKEGSAYDWREERNSLYSLSASVSLGINGTIRNFNHVVGSIKDDGKEREFRNALALMNDSLHGLFSDIFRPTSEYHHQYPAAWTKRNSMTLCDARLFTPAPVKEHTPAKRAILLLGAPGIGKSTQTERIIKQSNGVMCISTGNLVRKLNAKVKANLPLNPVESYAAESLELMRQGKLMDDKAVYALLMAHLSRDGEGYDEYQRSHTIILDGVIKERANIESFNAALNDFNKNNANTPMELKEVINIDAPENELIARQKKRMQEAAAKGAEQRPDDSVEIYSQRLKAYLGMTKAIIDYYQSNQAYHFTNVDGSATMEETNQKLMRAITSDERKIVRGLNAKI